MLKIKSIINKIGALPGLEKIIFNTSWILTDNIVRLVVNTIVSVWVARYLGPSIFGTLSYAVAIVSLLSIISNLGVNDFVVKEHVSSEKSNEEIAGSAFFLKIIGAIISIVAAMGLILLTYGVHSQMMVIVILISLGYIFQSFDVIDLRYQSTVMSKYSIWARNPAFLLASLLKIYFILTGKPVEYFALAALIEISIGTIGIIFIYSCLKNNIFKWKIDGRIVKALFISGFPIILSGTLTLIYLKIDRIFVGQFLGQTALGNYSAATALADPWIFVPAAIAGSVFPAIIITKMRDNDLYLVRMQKLYSFLIQLGVIIAVLTTIFSPLLVHVLYGDRYIGASPILAIYIWTQIFVFADAGAMKWYLVEGLQRYLVYRALFGTILALITSYFLINKFGIIGGAISAVFTQFSVIYLFSYFFSKTKNLFHMQTKALLDVLTFHNFKYLFKNIL